MSCIVNSCPQGLYGETCAEGASLCESLDFCYNNGDCIIKESITSCNCPPGTFISLLDCWDSILNAFHSLPAKYLLLGFSQTCHCFVYSLTEFGGDGCQLQRDPCNVKPCENSGTCYYDSAEEEHECHCPPGILRQCSSAWLLRAWMIPLMPNLILVSAPCCSSVFPSLALI